MKAGDVIQMDRNERITCIKSGADDGRFIYEVWLGPGVEGPPMHSHAEGPEVVEMVAGAIEFEFADGEKRLLRPGDRLEIPAGRVHTFRNASKTEPCVGRGEHGHRFERAIDQFTPGRANFVRLCRYLVTVDPHASYMHSRGVRAMMRVVSAIGRLRGVDTV
jgi:mannose-6-phosphate isomerase-like protein (cupin superfamily)